MQQGEGRYVVHIPAVIRGTEVKVEFTKNRTPVVHGVSFWEDHWAAKAAGANAVLIVTGAHLAGQTIEVEWNGGERIPLRVTGPGAEARAYIQIPTNTTDKEAVHTYKAILNDTPTDKQARVIVPPHAAADPPIPRWIPNQ